ncbi:MULTISPECIES: diguanylate cyclase [Marinomonas]|uniref:diguanylate cyclase n=1 Tax=Marinomonas alcarazii TaxID=491949 RepID=A0A318VAK5_9GAMM|nr:MULTISPECIES: diguanylate cyclase [Marinomonas]PYF84548.1 PAS domain S-box-containing protein/diguanylate cyclase (GGDEF)-like protein [Marinomonas alcarazii]
MHGSIEFLKAVIDSIASQLAVIDSQGNIVYVNKSWCNFGTGSGQKKSSIEWDSINYLTVCDGSSGDDGFGADVAQGIRDLIKGETNEFQIEYPCHTPTEKRWFIMRCTPFDLDDERFIVIVHQDVSQRKLAEEAVERLARFDSLTDIHNRRAFDEHLEASWSEAIEGQLSLNLAMMDLDYFKRLNDFYGHQAGDDCLVQVAGLLKTLADKHGFFCARYGGEEFAMIWVGKPISSTLAECEAFLQGLYGLQIPQSYPANASYLTASIGLVELTPSKDITIEDAFRQADALLYQAKQEGRNKVVHCVLSEIHKPVKTTKITPIA